MIVLVVAVVGCLLYAAAGFFLAPHLIESRLTVFVAERLGGTFSAEKLKVNPFALSVEATGVRVAQGNGSPILAARRVYLNLDLLGSGFGRGWVLGEAQSDGLQVQLELQRNGRFNFADVAQRWGQGSRPAKPDDAPVRVTIRHLLASDGEVTYRKLSGSPAATQVLPIRLELVNVSTLPDRDGHYSVNAHLVDGGALTWRGDLSMLPTQSEGDLALEGLKLATVWKFFRDELLLAEPEGSLSVATHYKFSYADGKPELGLTGLRVNASGLRVVREGFHQPILAMKTLEARDGSFQLERRTLVLPVVSLGGGSVNVVKDANGTWNWTGFVRDKDSASNVPPSAREPGAGREAARTWRIDMNAVNVDNVALHYEDQHRPTPFAVTSAAMHGKAAIAVVTGGDSLGVLAHDMDLRLEKLTLPATTTPTASLTELRIQGGYVDLPKQALGANQLLVDGGRILVERGADGALPIVQMFAGGGETPSPKSLWRFAVGSLQVRGLEVALSDQSFGKRPIAYQFGGISASIDNVAIAGDKPMAFKASARIGSGGSIAASGSAAQDFSRVDARVKLSTLALAPLQPFITRYASVDLASGNVSASAILAYRDAGGKPTFSAMGPFELANVRLNEAGSDTTVLAWQRLSTGEARLTLSPDRLSIREIIVEAPEVKIDISEKRDLNLAQLFKHQPPPGNQPPARDAAKEPQFPVQIGELRVRDGIMDFSDRSLVLPFSTQVTDLTGTASGLRSNNDRHATLQFEGDIGEFGSADINGRIDAFSPKTFTDIDVAFRNVELPDLSPYSVTFLGRKIASGKLWVDLKYGIENSQLTGNNDITIHDLRLGNPVDTPTALKLPLDLAVALLTDSEGRIRFAVPVKGDLNNPKFDFATLIREALGNLIKKIVSAPFRALAGLFGHNRGKDFGNIEFEAGSAKLLPSEKEKLQEVAKAMSERPQLKLIVQAPYAAHSDRKAMKQELASRDVSLALGRSPDPGEKPGPVVFESLATQRVLERLLAKKTDSNVVRELVARYTKRTGEAPKRAGMLERRPGNPDFYETVYAQLVEAQPIASASLQNLAAGRAEVVLDSLRSAGVDPARLESGPVEPSKQEDSKRISAELSLEPIQSPRTTAVPKAPEIAQASR